MSIEQTEMQKVNVLWTGGYDSSFRIVELSKKNVIIQPYYLSDNRASEEHELSAISRITSDVLNHPETKCIILPLLIFKTSEIRPDQDITNSYKAIRKVVPIGSQYDWLARFAKEHNIDNLELTIEKAESNKALMALESYGTELKYIEEKSISFYEIDKDSDYHIENIFGRFHLPAKTFNLSKSEMIKEYKELGFEQTMLKTWFCHRPIRNKPCGVCNPCKSTLSEGMDFRFPKSSLVRNKFSKLYNTRGVSKLLRLFDR